MKTIYSAPIFFNTLPVFHERAGRAREKSKISSCSLQSTTQKQQERISMKFHPKNLIECLQNFPQDTEKLKKLIFFWEVKYPQNLHSTEQNINKILPDGRSKVQWNETAMKFWETNTFAAIPEARQY